MKSKASTNYSLNMNIKGFTFETEEFIIDSIVAFLDEYWTLSIWAAVIYVFVIAGGKRFMQSHQRYQLNGFLATWNLMLALFSMMGSYRMLPNLLYSVRYQSFYDSVCTLDWTYIPVVQLWTSLFSISKIIELGDTVFIVLRKQPLLFLHWYHHVTVLVYTWHSYADRTSSGRWYIAMNYAVHSVMYTYYALRALKYRAPNYIRMAITLLQISQMIVGIYIGIYVYGVKQSGLHCDVSYNNLYFSSVMYCSYCLLFVKFFYDAYLNRSEVTTRKSGQGQGHFAALNGSSANHQKSL